MLQRNSNLFKSKRFTAFPPQPFTIFVTSEVCISFIILITDYLIEYLFSLTYIIF
jgi:hypothetical protein